MSAQVLQIHQHFFLIDCGEGTQMRMSDFDIPRNKIRQIFISHLHGDHVFGLPGLLFSFALNDRREPLDIFSPPGLKEMILAQLRPGGGELPFALHFHEVNPALSELIFENKDLTVHTLPLRHRIPTTGFLFREKIRPRNIRPEKIAAFGLSIPQIKAAKVGEDIALSGGRILSNEELTLAPPAPRSFAYVSDTAFEEKIIPLIEGVDLLYHEATFTHDLLENAEMTLHSTARQAATIALRANVKRLILGHFSSRYQDLQPLLEEAKEVFPETELGEEGKTREVYF